MKFVNVLKRKKVRNAEAIYAYAYSGSNMSENIDIRLLAGLLGLCGIIFVLILILYVLYDKNRRRKRLAAIPRELSSALSRARGTAAACLAMRQSLAFASRVVGMKGIYGTKDLPGPSEINLLRETREASMQRIKKCRALSIEALGLVLDARYCVLRSLFYAAEVECWNCLLHSSIETCPAAGFLEQVVLET